MAKFEDILAKIASANDKKNQHSKKELDAEKIANLKVSESTREMFEALDKEFGIISALKKHPDWSFKLDEFRCIWRPDFLFSKDEAIRNSESDLEKLDLFLNRLKSVFKEYVDKIIYSNPEQAHENGYAQIIFNKEPRDTNVYIITAFIDIKNNKITYGDDLVQIKKEKLKARKYLSKTPAEIQKEKKEIVLKKLSDFERIYHKVRFMYNQLPTLVNIESLDDIIEINKNIFDILKLKTFDVKDIKIGTALIRGGTFEITFVFNNDNEEAEELFDEEVLTPIFKFIKDENRKYYSSPKNGYVSFLHGPEYNYLNFVFNQNAPTDPDTNYIRWANFDVKEKKVLEPKAD